MKHILVIEDSKLLRLANERILAKAGYLIETASDGEEGLEKAIERIPDLILLDMLLPKLGGPEVLRALRKNPRTANIPVIVMSSLCQANERKLVAEGATAYFEKSKLELDKKSDSFVGLVQEILGEQPEQRTDAEATHA